MPRPSATRTTAATTPSSPAATPSPSPVPVLWVDDGDTIIVRIGTAQETVRIIGIDAPEVHPAECFAAESTAALKALIAKGSVTMTSDPAVDDRDRYGRLLRHLRTASGVDPAERLIRDGAAREYTYDRAYAGRDRYLAAQKTAQAAGRGVWSQACTNWVPPVVATQVPPDPACAIKGNIAEDGTKIYHLPGQEDYDATRITTSAGERWFCTEADAVAAGWRKAKR